MVGGYMYIALPPPMYTSIYNIPSFLGLQDKFCAYVNKKKQQSCVDFISLLVLVWPAFGS